MRIKKLMLTAIASAALLAHFLATPLRADEVKAGDLVPRRAEPRPAAAI